MPYLTGYVAYYGGDYKTAISDLQKANQEDPFILVLQAQAYEKMGDAAKAKEYYGKVMANNGHGPTNAFARPIARKKLEGS
jgi:tetratricopeptide (TPR) repeat protein